MTELRRNDFDSHDWAARASEALAQAKRFPPGSVRSEAIGKAGQLRVAADMKELLMSKEPNGVPKVTGGRRSETIGRVSNSESQTAPMPISGRRSIRVTESRTLSRKGAMFCVLPDPFQGV
jgi:hypothetical protein